MIPYLMVGSIDEIVGHVHACRERWGITYFVVRALDEFAPDPRRVRLTRRPPLKRRSRELLAYAGTQEVHEIAYSDAISARASTVFQLRAVPDFALSSRVTAAASLLRPMPLGSDR